MQTFFGHEKAGSAHSRLSRYPYRLVALATAPLDTPEVHSRGITHETESNSNCLGQATVVLVRWTFQPVAVLIVGHVSSGVSRISDNVSEFKEIGAVDGAAWARIRSRRAACRGFGQSPPETCIIRCSLSDLAVSGRRLDERARVQGTSSRRLSAAVPRSAFCLPAAW